MAKADAAYPTTAEELSQAHAFAAGLYTDANRRSDEVIATLTEGLPIPRDVTDAGNVQVTQMVLVWAIIERFRQMLQVEGSQRQRVVPLKDGREAAERATKIERWLTGFQRRLRYQQKRNYERDASWWFLARGVCRLEVRFLPELVNTNQMPLAVLCDDPATIHPVAGRHGPLWYTKEYLMYVREFEAMAARMQNPVDTAWLGKTDLEPNDQVTIIEYWDDTWTCALARPQEEKESGQLLYTRAHQYGFLPLAEGHCMDTPLADAEWSYQSVVGPVLQHIKQIYTLMSKLATGVNLFFYPYIFYVDAQNRPVILDPMRLPTDVAPMPPGAKFEIIRPEVNAQVLMLLTGMFRSDVNLATLPETAWGAEPQSLQSGFAVAQVLNQVASAVQDKAPQLAQAFGETRANALRLYKQFGRGTGVDLAVPVDYDE